jgi:lipopolysaccharide transport system permease protein
MTPVSALTPKRSNDFNLLRHLWQRRELIVQLVRREVSQRYRGSYLGVLWSFVTPLLLLLIYTFVFSVVLNARLGRTGDNASLGEFALTLFAGLIPFNVFSDVVNRAPRLILNAPNYVKKVVFPLEVLPVVALGSALVNSIISAGVLVLGNLVFRQSLSPTLFLLPLAYLPLGLLCLGLGWLLASLGVYIRDLGQGIGLVVQMLFFLSPIFYSVTALPEPMRRLYAFNPFTMILTSFRQTILWGQALDWGMWLVWTTLTAVLALLGYMWFMKTKKGFADVM